MDIGVTISKVRKEYREYLRETHPDWADTTISTHVSDAFYLYQNTIALSFWKCFESDASMEKAKGEIFDYLKQEVMSDRADERTAQYYRDLKRLKEFIDSKGGVKTYIGYEYDCEVIVYKYAKMVYDGTMEMDAAVKAMCQEVPCFGETSHKLTIMLFASMMKGIKYTRRSNTETTVYFIVHIGKDYGQEQMVNALKATQENIKYYYEQTGNKSNSVDEDAKGAEIEIKKGTTVNELNTDAKIKLTGKGRIDLLDVSASGVTFDKNLNIRKTDTSNGATAPKENGSTSTGGNSGGSSGGSSGTASKEITGAEKVTRDVPYGTSADDALAAIPKTVTLKLKGGSTTTTTVTNWKWADGVSYNATPTENTNYKATTTVTIPSGYTYNGTLTAEATVTVHPLDKTKLEAAKNAYMDLQNKQTYDEKKAATDKEKILIKDSTPDQITAGVRFATPKDWRPLDDAIKSVENQERIGFASQQKCDDTAKTLQAAIDDFIQNKVKVGTSKTTDAYILQQVKDELLKPDKGDYAYSSKLQPLKSGSAYPLYMGSWTADNGVYVDIQWTATGEGTQYVTKIEDSSASGNDTLGYYELNGIRNTVSRGALIGGTPDKPTEVTFTATVKNSMTQKEIGTIDYTALIGAPISVSANQPSTVPQFTVISDGTSSSTGATKFTGVVPITLNGAEAITDVSDGCVTMDAQSTLSDSSKVSFSHISVDKVEKSDTGLNVTVTVTTGAIGGVWDENSPYPFKEGILLNISIDTSKLQLKENTLGWYLPTDNTLKLKDMTVEVLTPAFTKVEYADDPTTGNPTFTIQTQNMPENAKVEVALEKKDVGAGGIDNATIKKDATRGDDGKYSVTFDKSEFESGAEYYLWFRYGSPGSDWAYESVTNRPTYTPNSTTGGGSDSSESGSGNTTEGSQAGA